jgi:hypothetical protein
MTDLYKALAEIDAIRGQMARGTEFRGYGPATIAGTGLLAFAAAGVQARLIGNPLHAIPGFLAIWTLTALIAVVVIGAETVVRTRRVHSGLARKMMGSAVEHFLPALLAGLMLTVVTMRTAPQNAWMLPGLWQLLFSLGVFASCKLLPRQTLAVGVWYLATGLICLSTGGGERALSPWAMGVPFGVGQLLVAAVLQFGYREAVDEHS